MRPKGEVRREYLIRRRNIAQQARAKADAAIRERALALPEIATAACVLSYIGAPPEVDTRGIIEALLRKGTRVLAPVMSADDDQMHWGEILQLDALVRGPYGMSQPSADLLAHVPPDAPVLTPLVVFTAQGDRLGRGGGHFDRFLADHQGPKIGLAYECQRAEEVPVEAHDARLDAVVTELKIWPEHQRR